jgi:hypothetical protein
LFRSLGLNVTKKSDRSVSKMQCAAVSTTRSAINVPVHQPRSSRDVAGMREPDQPDARMRSVGFAVADRRRRRDRHEDRDGRKQGDARPNGAL